MSAIKTNSDSSMDLRQNKGYLIAAGLFIISCAWIMSGPAAPTKIDITEPKVYIDALTSVQVKTFTPLPIDRELTIHGVSAANREVTVRAETEGRITKIFKQQGDTVAAGEVIALIDIRDSAARLEQAKALVVQRQLEYQGSQKLKTKGLLHDADLAGTLTLLKTAEADAIAMQIRVNASKLKAPFNGILDSSSIEQGNYVKIGDDVFTVLDYSPLVIHGDITEKDALTLKRGDIANVKMVTGESLTGQLSYVASKANVATHTFNIEVRITSTNAPMKAGITSNISIPLPMAHGIKTSPTLLLLDDDGVMGMKGISAENTVVFYPVTISKAEVDGIWITGLPSPVTLITSGQGYVIEGESVIAVHHDKQINDAQALSNTDVQENQ
jgi:multidrug efflux system membrane fusion protein